MNLLPQSSQRFFKVFRISLLTLLLLVTLVSKANGQFSLSSETGSGSGSLPRGVARYGNIEVIQVQSHVDGNDLFEIASPTVFNRDQPGDRLPVEIRAEQITAALDRVVERFEQPEVLSISFGTLNNLTILEAVDEKNSRRTRLVTVTNLDASYQGQSVDEVAQQWQKVLQEELEREIQLFSPPILKQRLMQAWQIFLGMVGLSFLVWLIQRLLRRREQTLLARQQAEVVASHPEIAAMEQGVEAKAASIATVRSHFLQALQDQLSLKRRLWFHSFFRWVIFWVQILIWYVGLIWIVSTVPGLMKFRSWLLGMPIELLGIFFATGLAIQISTHLLDYFTNVWRDSPLITFTLGDAQRRALRTETLLRSLKGLTTFLIAAIGVIVAFNLLGISTGSVVAGGAIIGLAISFGSQNLIKDLVNGCLILAEDQFAVGDVIDLGTAGGLVENLNLRVTQLRDAEGRLITVPNSSIISVKNLTRSWSRVDFSIEVAYETDLKQALTVLDQVAQQMYGEPDWREQMPEPPQVLGVDHLAHTGMLLRVWIKTAPLQQWSVGREFRYRVRLAFEEHGIQIGKPQWIIDGNAKETPQSSALMTESHERIDS